jgi:hypothetical protein
LPKNFRHAPVVADDIFGIHFQLLQANAPWAAFLHALFKEILQRYHETKDNGYWDLVGTNNLPIDTVPEES